MDDRRMSNPPRFSGEYKPQTRSSSRRELDIFLLQVDRNMGKLLAVVIIAAFVCAFVFAKPGDPAYALMQWVLR